MQDGVGNELNHTMWHDMLTGNTADAKHDDMVASGACTLRGMDRLWKLRRNNKTTMRLFVQGAWTCVLQSAKVCANVSTAILVEARRDTQRGYKGKVHGSGVIDRFESPWMR